MSESLAARAVRTPLWLAACALVGMVGVAVGFEFALATMKMRVAIAVALMAVTLILSSRHRVGLLLAAWVLMLTYNRQYFSFDRIYGDFDSQGLYWIPADLALLALAGVHAFTVWRRGRPFVTQRGQILSYLPFLAAAALASITAVHPSWAFAEWMRLAKLGAAFLLLRELAIGTSLWMAVGALGLAVVLQSSLGVLQVAFNTTTGLLSMFTGGAPGKETVVAGLTAGARARASGTMTHPNILGPYLLFVLPIFVALSVGASDRRVRVAAATVCAAGYLGLIATMSRLPIAIGGTEAAAVLILLVVMRGVSLKKVLALVSFAAILLTFASAYYADAIAKRFSGDLGRSIEFRTQYNRVAISIWREFPFLGIGLNNFNEGLRQRDALLSKMVDEMQGDVKKFGVRATAPVHNVYLLVLAETGLIGLATFVLFLAASLRTAWGAALHASGSAQLVCLGIAVGFLGQYLQQMMDFSMWMDPGLFTFALLLAISVNAARAEDADSVPVVDTIGVERVRPGTPARWTSPEPGGGAAR